MTLRFSFDADELRAAELLAELTTSESLPCDLLNWDAGTDFEFADAEHVPELRVPTYVPEHYEPNYAYPLLVWLRQPDQTGPSLPTLMSQISNRNYLGISVAAAPPQEFAGEQRESVEPDRIAALSADIFRAVTQTRQLYHVHSERIFLAGFGKAGTLALAVMLHRPEWFAGVIAHGASFPQRSRALLRFRDLRGKRALLGAAIDNPADRTQLVTCSRLLHAAGLRVCPRYYDNAEASAPLFRDIDRWVMREIYEPQVVV